jgi:cytochrome c oxidase subunit 2
MGDRERGEKLFSNVGCIGCHTVKEVGGNVGPDLSEVARRAPDRATVQGLDLPELYFVQSVVYPKAFVVEGFNPVMPNWKELQLAEQDLADLVAYLRTLDGE